MKNYKHNTANKTNFKTKASFVGKFIWYMAYGFAAIVSLTYAALNALNKPISLSQDGRYMVLICIAITAAPVLAVLGRIIIKGILGLAEKESE